MVSNSNFVKAPLPLKSIPEDWHYEIMNNLMEFKNGYAFNSKDYSNYGKIILRMSNISVTGALQINTNNVRYCTLDDYKQLDGYHLSKGDLIISMTDVTPDKAIVGRTAIIDNSNSYILNQRVGRIRVNNRIDNVFLHYYTNSNSYLNYIRSMSSGSAQFNLSTKDIKNTVVPIPLIKEQRKIAEILSSVDEAIEKTEQIIEQTETVKKGLMQQLLAKGIGHDRFKQTKIGKIPFSWKVKNLYEISDFITKGSTPTTYGFKWQDKGIYFFKSDVVKDGQFVYGDYKYISQEAHMHMKRSKIVAEDVVITITGNIGRVAVVPEEIHEANINQHIARIRINNENVKSTFIYYWLNQEKIVHNYGKIKTGLAYPQLSLKQVRETKVPIPPLEEQQKIIEILSSFDEKIKKDKNTTMGLKTLKQGLMQQLLTGKVRVPINDGEEVPS